MEPDHDKTQTHFVLTEGTEVGHYKTIEKIPGRVCSSVRDHGDQGCLKEKQTVNSHLNWTKDGEQNASAKAGTVLKLTDEKLVY